MDVPPSSSLLYFDDLLHQIGGTGAYQFIFYIIICALQIFSVETIYIIFIAVDIPHWCKVKELVNLPFEVQKNVAIPSDNRNDWMSTGTFSQCQMFNLNYSAYSTEDFLSWNRTIQAAGNTPVSCTHGWTYDRCQFASSAVDEAAKVTAADLALSFNVIISAQYDLVCDQAWLVPLLATAFNGGQFFGAVSAGFFSDRYGRRPVLVMYGLFKFAGGIFTAFAPNYGCMLVARAINGFGTAGFSIIAFVLILEVSRGKARSIFGTGVMIAFALGYMLIPSAALAVRDFRKISLVMTGPAIICFFIWWIVPESPRWLLTNGKLKQADKAIRFIANVNNKPLPEDFDISQIKMDHGKSTDLPRRNLLDLFKQRRICIWTLIVYLHWFTDSLMYLAMSLNTGSLAGNIFVNTFLMGLIEIPANILLIFTLPWLHMGRRISASAPLLVAGGTCLICIPLIVVGASPTAITALSLIGKGGATMAYSAIYVYTGEIFPTEVRNVAMGSASTVACLSGMGAPFVGGILGDAWAGLPYLVYGVFGVTSGLLTLYLPETLGRPLCETIDEAMAAGNHKQAVSTELAVYLAGSFSQIEDSTGITHKNTSTSAAHDNKAFNDNIN